MKAAAQLWTGAAHMRTKKAEQLSLGHDEREYYRYEATKMLKEVGRTISLIGIKEVAYQLQTTEAALTHSVAQRGRHYFRAEWLDYLLKKSPDLELARTLCEPAGLVVDRAPDFTDADLAEARRQVQAEQLGADIHQAMEERSYRRATQLAARRRG